MYAGNHWNMPCTLDWSQMEYMGKSQVTGDLRAAVCTDFLQVCNILYEQNMYDCITA